MSVEKKAEEVRVRFFSKRVFGAWVDAVVVGWTAKTVTLAANFQGNEWWEKVPADTEFYFPQGHPRQGEAFKLEAR